MGCSSSNTQPVAQENIPGVKPEGTKGDKGFDAETIADQMQLPVQGALPEGLGPRPGVSQTPAARIALQNMGLWMEQAAAGCELTTVGRGLMQTDKATESPAPEMPGVATEHLTPQEERVFLGGVAEQDSAGANHAVEEMNLPEASPPTEVPQLLESIAMVTVATPLSVPAEGLVACGTLTDTAEWEAALGAPEAASAQVQTPAVEPLSAVECSLTPEPTPAPGPTLMATSAVAPTPAPEPSLVLEASLGLEPTTLPARAETPGAELQVEREQDSPAGSIVDADTLHQAELQALEAPGGGVSEGTTLLTKIERAKIAVAVTGAEMAAASVE